MIFVEIYHDSEENPLKNLESNESHSVSFTKPRTGPITSQNETKSEPLVNKKLYDSYMLTNIEGEEQKLRETKSPRHQKKRNKITKIIINNSVKTTGPYKRLKSSTRHQSGTNNDTLKIKSKAYELEPRFCFQYEREPQKCHWSTTAVKCMDFMEYFSSGYDTTFRKYRKGNRS